MKKPYMRTIIDSFGRDCVLIILFKAGLFIVITPNLHIGRRANPVLTKINAILKETT